MWRRGQSRRDIWSGWACVVWRRGLGAALVRFGLPPSRAEWRSGAAPPVPGEAGVRRSWSASPAWSRLDSHHLRLRRCGVRRPADLRGMDSSERRPLKEKAQPFPPEVWRPRAAGPLHGGLCEASASVPAPGEEGAGREKPGPQLLTSSGVCVLACEALSPQDPACFPSLQSRCLEWLPCVIAITRGPEQTRLGQPSCRGPGTLLTCPHARAPALARGSLGCGGGPVWAHGEPAAGCWGVHPLSPCVLPSPPGNTGGAAGPALGAPSQGRGPGVSVPAQLQPLGAGPVESHRFRPEICVVRPPD